MKKNRGAKKRNGAKEHFSSRAYQREKDLPALIPLWPAELNDFSKAGTGLIMKKIKSALRAERKRGNSAHWSYDLNRHIALARALKEEARLLENISHDPQK